MDVHNRVGGPGFIEQAKDIGGKAFDKIKETFSNLKLPDTAKVKQEMENAQILGKQLSENMTLKMLGMISLPGSKDKIMDILKKKDSRKEIPQEKLYVKKEKAEKLEVKAQNVRESWGRTLMTVGKFVGSQKIYDKGDKIEGNALGKGLKAMQRKHDFSLKQRELSQKQRENESETMGESNQTE